MPEQGDNAIYKIARAAIALEQFAFETPTHALMGARGGAANIWERTLP